MGVPSVLWLLPTNKPKCQATWRLVFHHVTKEPNPCWVTKYKYTVHYVLLCKKFYQLHYINNPLLTAEKPHLKSIFQEYPWTWTQKQKLMIINSTVHRCAYPLASSGFHLQFFSLISNIMHKSMIPARNITDRDWSFGPNLMLDCRQNEKFGVESLSPMGSQY